MKFIVVGIILFLMIAYLVFATQQKSFKCGVEKGSGKTTTQNCK